MRVEFEPGWVVTDEVRRLVEENCDEIALLIRSVTKIPLPNGRKIKEYDGIESDCWCWALQGVDTYLTRWKGGDLMKFLCVYLRNKLRDCERMRYREGAAKVPPVAYDTVLHDWSSVEIDSTEGMDFNSWSDKVNTIWNLLSPRDRGILYLRLHPPPELLVIQRNVAGSVGPPCREALSIYTGIPTHGIGDSIRRCNAHIKSLKLGSKL
jgi:hypothetical protein